MSIDYSKILLLRMSVLHLSEYKFVVLHNRLDGFIADRGACVPGPVLALHGEDVPKSSVNHLCRTPAREVWSPPNSMFNHRDLTRQVSVMLVKCEVTPRLRTSVSTQLEASQCPLFPPILSSVSLHPGLTLCVRIKQSSIVSVRGDSTLSLLVQVGIVHVVRSLLVVLHVYKVDCESLVRLTAKKSVFFLCWTLQGSRLNIIVQYDWACRNICHGKL